MNRKEFEIWTRNHIRLMDGATEVGCSGFAEAVVERM